MTDPFLGLIITLPDGPWAGQRVEIVAQTRDERSRLPISYYRLRRLDTGEIGYRNVVSVMFLALSQGALRQRD